ncbi:hypothetical protein SanaruYs_01350 [Chryseotalea sanaruensis]|uniref:Peptidase M50 domain-containing protein n=1 Tax=Chryseotalea sanaruensis TaxID=2482724 RepID=A0A401U4U3_9BACT|nr:M50 family metallopeptidase [Chryseotalea sanaruensis]GCC49921.1 hypothetical protein SanaruYs_01350 [Chryseotalea sanaruensis]
MKYKKFKQIASIIILGSLGGLAGLFLARLGLKTAHSTPLPVVLAMAILFVPAFFFVVAVHEAGHAWAGIKMNFDFRTYIVGPLLWNKEPDGWKFKRNKNINTSGGLVICTPRGSQELTKRFSIFAAGGPIASLLLAVVAFTAHALLKSATPLPLVLHIVSNLLLLIAYLSIAIFVITAIPLHTGGFSSDGARILRLQRGGDTARFEVLLLKTISEGMGGTRPLLFNADELDEAKQLAVKLEAHMGLYIDYFLYQQAADQGNIEKAEAHLKDYLAQVDAIPEGLRASVWIDAAFFYAYYKKDLAKAESYFQQYKPSPMTGLMSVHAVSAAMAFLKEDWVNVRTHFNHAQDEMPKMMDQGMALVLQEKLNQMFAAIPYKE